MSNSSACSNSQSDPDEDELFDFKFKNYESHIQNPEESEA